MRALLRGETGWNEVAPERVEAALRAGEGTLWVDITGPSAEDARILHEVFGFHPLAIEDTRNQRQRPKAEEFPDHLFLILNPVDQENGRPVFRELDVFIGERYLVTVHPEEEPLLEAARRRLESRPAQGADSAHLLYLLLDEVVDGYFPVLDQIGDQIEELEDLVLRRPTLRSLDRLFALKRALVEMRRVVGPQRDMFNRLGRRDLEVLDDDALQYHLRDVYDHLLRITDTLDTYRDLLTSGIDLYMSATSNRLNQVVNRLTAVTVAIGTLAVLTGFYGMNFAHTWPPFAAPWGVPFALGAMAGLSAVLYLVFRRSGWF